MLCYKHKHCQVEKQENIPIDTILALLPCVVCGVLGLLKPPISLILYNNPLKMWSNVVHFVMYIEDSVLCA